MSVVIKRIGGGKYAYMAYRQGKRVVQKYLGSLRDPAVSGMLTELKTMRRIPRPFFPLFWDVDPSKVDLKKHARYVIARILELGGFDAVLWLQRIYPVSVIMETCEVSREISPRSKNFWRVWFEAPRVS